MSTAKPMTQGEMHANKLQRFGAHSKCDEHKAECDGVTYRERVQFTTYTCGCAAVVLPSGIGFFSSNLHTIGDVG